MSALTKWFSLDEDAEGNAHEMAVEFDADGKLIEVGITYFDKVDVVFHADNATPTWQKKKYKLE